MKMLSLILTLALLAGGSAGASSRDEQSGPRCRHHQVSVCNRHYGGRVLLPLHVNYGVLQGRTWRA